MNDSPRSPRRVAVVGGGVSGLAAACQLARARREGAPVEEYLFEAGPRLGGALRTESIDGCLIETGADSFLTEKPDAAALCRELGLGDQLIGSEDHQRRTWIVLDRQLVTLPDGLEFIIPTRVLPTALSPLFTWPDRFEILSEAFTPQRRLEGDESVADFVTRHFGRRLVDILVDPMLNGIYGADTSQLSVRAVLPRLVEMEKQWGSLLLGMQQARRNRVATAGSSNARPPIFTALRGGFKTLVEAVSATLSPDRIRTNCRVTALEKTSTGYRLGFEGAPAFEADRVILALPAWASGRLVEPVHAPLAGLLSGIPYASSLVVALVYDAASVADLPRGFGFLVPRREGLRLRACTFVGQKFSHRVPEGKVMLRCFLGGATDEEILGLGDDEVFALIRTELRQILGLHAAPVAARAFRWDRAMAQYPVGHLGRLEAIEGHLAGLEGLFLAGNGYRGIGVPDCVRSGRQAAENALRGLRPD